MTFDPLDLATKLLRHGADWADKNAGAELLEESKKSLRAELAIRALIEAKTLGKAELIAESSSEYRDHIKAMVEARRKANRARVQYDTDKAYVEMVRSQESTRRAEMQIK